MTSLDTINTRILKEFLICEHNLGIRRMGNYKFNVSYNSKIGSKKWLLAQNFLS